MPFIAQAEISTEIQNGLNLIEEKMPNGEVPHKEALADLKGILPNQETMKSVLACGTAVPSQFLVDFDPESSIFQTVPIPKPNIEIQDPIIDVVDREPEDIAPINTEGLSDEEIERKEKLRQELIEKNKEFTDKFNKLQREAAEKINNLGKEANNVMGASVLSSIAAPGTMPDMVLKITAYKFFKAQLAAAEEKVKKVQEEVDITLEEAEKVLELKLIPFKKIKI